MRRTLLAFVGGLILLLLAVPMASAAIRLTEGAAKFPTRQYILTLDSATKLVPSSVIVTENGASVDSLKVVPGDQSAGTRFGTVLAIDTSDSMHGNAIASAIGAAREFARRRAPGQPLGLVFFNGTTRVALPMTTDAAAIDKALSTIPPLARGTHVYDGVSTGISMLAKAGISAGSVIVLSDGTDTGSLVKQPALVAAARQTHTRIFAVGFRTRAYSPTSLTALATAARGDFTSAGSTAGLAALYRRLGIELSNQYVITYRSTEPLGSSVNVGVKVRGFGQATSGYFAPALPAPAIGQTTGGKSFIQTDTALIAVVVAAAVLIGLAMLVVLSSGRSVRQRVGQFVDMPDQADERAWTGTLLTRTFGDRRRRRSRERGARFVAFAEELELARIGMSPGQVLAWTAVGTVVVGWLFATTAGPAGAVFGLLVPVAVRLGIIAQVNRQRSLFDDQLPDNLQVIASAMRAGHTFLGAVGVVVEDAPEPSRRELRRILADEQLGTPLADAMAACAVRMHSRDFEHVALVATLQRDSGGNTAEVIDRVTESIRERLDLRRLVRTLTAQGRLAGFVVAGLPIVLLAAISAINPGYLHPMFHTGTGVFLLILAGFMLLLGAWIIKRIVDIDV